MCKNASEVVDSPTDSRHYGPSGGGLLQPTPTVTTTYPPEMYGQKDAKAGYAWNPFDPACVSQDVCN